MDPVDANHPLIARADQRPREGWDDPTRGDASWFTLFSGDRTPTTRMCAGVMELPPGGVGLRPHRHAAPEIYYITEGNGVVFVDGEESAVTAGSAVFIPGDAEHGVRNTGDVALRIFYVFPTNRFSDVVYRFPGA
jgi:mannose-6-phosphate isomerase-like protein (cupin superfamily)